MKNAYNLISLIALSLFSLNVSASLITFSCDFPNYVTDEDRGTQNFKIVFEVDTISGQAYMKGNNGLSEVVNIPGQEGISFIETLGTGAVQTTTIVLFPDSQLGNAVHSRHSLISGLVPSQNYGVCILSE